MSVTTARHTADPRRLPPFEPTVDALRHARFSHFVDVAVRYCETDGARHVNHTVFPAYLEHGLLKLLADVGDPAQDGQLAFDHVTAELVLRYFAPSFFGETLRVGSRLVRVGRSSAVVEQVVLGERDAVRVAARIAIVRTRDGRSEPWTDEQRARLSSHLPASA
jgi:acyl-CoA thioester hydrolase